MTPPLLLTRNAELREDGIRKRQGDASFAELEAATPRRRSA